MIEEEIEAAKKAREEAKKARAQGRQDRLTEAQERQRDADTEVYGKGSQLLASQKSSSDGDARGGIWDISTDNYKQPERNETDQNSNIDDDGIDSIGAGSEDASAAGDGDGFSLVTFDVVKDDNTAGQYRWRAEEVTP